MYKSQKFFVKKLLVFFIIIISFFCITNFVSAVNLENPLATTNVNSLIQKIITSVLGVTGTLAFLVFIIGGIMWITSGGNEDKVKKGTETMVWAGIGVVVIFSSYAIINLVLKSLLK
ncbi:MAG: pilin [Patescibacteria group bacterium]